MNGVVDKEKTKEVQEKYEEYRKEGFTREVTIKRMMYDTGLAFSTICSIVFEKASEKIKWADIVKLMDAWEETVYPLRRIKWVKEDE